MRREEKKEWKRLEGMKFGRNWLVEKGQGYGTRWGLASMHQGIQTRSAWKMRMWAGRSALLDGA